MAERDVTVALSSDTNGFSEGIQQAKKILLELNKTLVDSQSTLKEATQELNTYEKEQKKLQEEMSKSGNDTEENRKKMALLTEKIKEQKEKVAQLRTEQTEIRGQISRATTALKNETNAVEEATKKNNNLSGAVSETSEELKKQGQEAENASEGFTVLKGAISNLVSDALRVAIDEFKEMSVSAEQSLNSLQVKTGMSVEAVGELKDEMYDIYKNNFGESLTDVADKLALVTQNIDESDPSKLKDITEKAIGLSDAFGSDFEENLRGVNGLMVNMGLTADEAFDLIAKGSQNGLDKTHELTDNLAEYSQIWGQAGFSAQEMFSILQNGLDSGAYKLDNVNDLVKEISISIIDGRLEKNISSFSDKTAQIFKSFKDGKATQSEVFDSMIDDLNTTSNLAEQLTTASDNWSALGEDNAMSVITALNNVNDTYSDVAGTMQEINDIQYNDVGNQIEALGRQFEIDILQPIVENVTPAVKNIISWVSDNLPEVTSALVGLTTGIATFKAVSAGGKFLQDIVNGFKALEPAIESATEAQKANNIVTENATKVQEANNIAVKANAYALIASLIFSAVSALLTWIATNNNATETIEKTKSSVENYAQAIHNAKSAAEEKEATTQSEVSLLKTLKGEYDELRKKTSLTAEEQKKLDNVAGQIAETMGTTTQALKDQSGAYRKLTSDVEDYIKQLRIKSQVESVQNILKEAYKVEFEVSEEDVSDARKAYDDYLQEIWNEVLKDPSKLKIVDGLPNGLVLNNKEQLSLYPNLVEKYDGDYNKLKRLRNTWADLYNQRDTALNSIEKYESELNELLGLVDEENDKTKGTSDEIGNLSDVLSDLTSKTNAVTKAEEEYNESGKLTASTLQAVINKYPELEDEVYNYMLGLTDAKTLIESMKNVYQDDLNAYIGVISQKASDSNTFYNQLINANANFVNEAKRQYGIDLLNFKNLQEAKVAMVEIEKSRVENALNPFAGFDSFKSYAGFNSGTLNNSFSKTIKDYSSKIAESIVSNFIGSAITATTNFTDFFGDYKKKGGGSGGGSSNSNSDKDNKYELASEAYNHLVDKRIEKIEKEAEAAEKAKDKKIAAIDAEIEARKRLNEDADRQAELDEINARLEYDQLSKLDRRELERKRQDLLNEQTQVEWERMMSDRKNSIQNGYDSQKDSYSQAIDSLQRAAISAENYFSRLAGTQTSSQIVNNNSDTRNIQIIANALSNQQMLDKLMNALYSK